MARSLSSIQAQIEKLQKEASAIRAAAVARIRKEMAQHGLTAEDLLGGGGDVVNNGRRPKRKAGVAKAAKYADGQGNTWGGMGKRPAWIHAVLAAGKSLEDFLVGAKPEAAPEESPAPEAPRKASRKAAAPKKFPAPKKAPAKKAARPAAAKKAPARKSSKKAAT